MKNARSFAVLFVLFAVTMLMYGCGSAGGGGGGGGGTFTPVSTTKGSISGRVFDQTGTALNGVNVTCNGGSATTTNTYGTFLFQSLDTGRKKVDVSLSGYESTQKIVDLAESGAEYIEIYLKLIGTSASVTGSSGGAVTDESATVIFPSGTQFKNAGGSAVTSANVTVTYFDPTSTFEITSFPGEFKGRIGSADSPFETYGFVSVNLDDGAGNPLQLASTAEIRIEIPAGQQTTCPATIELWSYNETDGIWVLEGIATQEGTPPSSYYSASVSHFTTWNVDKVLEVSYLKGAVVDEKGDPIVGATVRATGVDYTGTAKAATVAGGTFTQLAVRKDSTVEVMASRGFNSVSAGQFYTPAAGVENDIGTIVLTADANPTATIITNGDATKGYFSVLTGPITGTLTPEVDRFFLNFFTGPYNPAGSSVEGVEQMPDIIVIRKWNDGIYRYSVEGELHMAEPITPAQGCVVSFDSGKKTYTFPMASGSGDFWNVFAVSVEGGAITGEVITINSYSNTTEFPIP